MVTTGTAVRDVRVALWAEHLRTPLGDELRKHLEDLDLALGIFRPEWLPPDAPAGIWRTPGLPAGLRAARVGADPGRAAVERRCWLRLDFRMRWRGIGSDRLGADRLGARDAAALRTHLPAAAPDAVTITAAPRYFLRDLAS